MIDARKTRFGRMSTATVERSPAATAELAPSPIKKKNAAIHAAATGTSLIGRTSIERTIGLVATSHAAIRPAAGARTRLGTTNDARNHTAPHDGRTRKSAAWPPTILAAAIIRGRPGE